MSALPYYKRFPSNFLRGIQHMTVEQIAVYTVTLELMYDGWAPVEDRTAKQRRDLAAMCGLSVRKFGTTLEELLAAGKLHRDLSGRLSNRKFEQLAKDRGIDTAATSEKSGKKPKDDRPDNRGDKLPASNGNKDLTPGDGGLTRARANPEPRIQNTEQNSAAPGLSQDAEHTVESEILQICRAMGVDLQASTHRHGWAYRWARMRTELDITVGDMIAAIETFKGQNIKFDEVRSLGLFKDRAIEKRVARQLNERLAARAPAPPPPAELTDREWFDALKLFLRAGVWAPSKGPSPLQPGCRAPGALLDQAEKKWIEQGNHPETFTQEGLGSVKWREHNAGPIPHPIPFAPRSK